MRDITFNPELASYQRKDGTHNIFIRITQHGKHKRYNIGYAVEKKFWNFEEHCVRRTHPMASMLNDMIRVKVSQLEEKLLKTKLQQTTISAKQLQQAIKQEILGENYFTYARIIISRFSNPGTRKMQESVLNSLKSFVGSEDLSFGEIDYEFLEKYKVHLKKNGDGTNTIWSKLKTIKAHYNKGIKAGLHNPKINAFTLIEMPRAKSKRVRFTEDEIKLIEDYQPKINSSMFHAKNIFMLSFLHWGIRVSDMLMLRHENINDGRLVYMAKKTVEAQKSFNIKIHPRAEKILKDYLGKEKKPSDFLFPFLKTLPEKYTEEELHEFINKKTAQINNELKDLAYILGLPKFSTNSARHSFAEITKNKTGNKKVVTEALGHSSEKITEAYFASVAEYKNDDLSDSVY
ncbi:site-specific integrase [Emticicia sediminis]